MSNSFKLKKNKVKHIDAEKSKETSEATNSSKFLKNRREKGTLTSNFAGKPSKDFSRKKT